MFCHVFSLLAKYVLQGLTDSEEMQSGLLKRGHLFLDVQSDAYLPNAGISWANIWVPLSSSPKGMGQGAGEIPSPES